MGGNLRECPLTRALHHSQCSEAFKGCLEDFFPFLFNTYSQNICSSLFHLISHGSKWAERILTPLLRMYFLPGTSHVHPLPPLQPPDQDGMLSRCHIDNDGSWWLHKHDPWAVFFVLPNLTFRFDDKCTSWHDAVAELI